MEDQYWQKTFNAGVAHLRRQGCQAIRDNEFGKPCVYRMFPTSLGAKVTACGVGGLIPDHEYDPKMEMATVFSNTEGGGLVRDSLVRNGYSLSMAKCLQLCHDQVGPSLWEARFEMIATVFGLYLEPK